MQLNNQIPMKRHVTSALELFVHSIFYTIQGEGIFAGKPAVFLRLGGCNLQCPACDTEYTKGAQTRSIREICELIYENGGKFTNLVVITGGEPFRQQLGHLIATLTQLQGYTVQIETNGTLFDDSVDYNNDKLFIMCSPKTGSVNDKLKPYITAYKYVGGANELEIPYGQLADNIAINELQDHSLSPDGLPQQALGHTAKPFLARPHEGFEGTVYLQPIDRQDEHLNKYHQQAVVQSCLTNGYTLCLQMHKIIGVD